MAGFKKILEKDDLYDKGNEDESDDGFDSESDAEVAMQNAFLEALEFLKKEKENYCRPVKKRVLSSILRKIQ